MKRSAMAVIAALFLTFGDVNASPSQVTQLQSEAIFPTVQVDAGRGTGSGTVIWSDERDGKIETYILTNNHVVRGAEFQRKELDEDDGKYVERVVIGRVQVIYHDYQDDGSRSIGTVHRPAEVVKRSATLDLALLKLVDDVNRFPHVAKLAPPDAVYRMGEPVWAVGGGLGYPPSVTDGYLGLKEVYIGGDRAMLLATSPIIFGNSGGGLYRKLVHGFELIGVPSNVAAMGLGLPVTHLGFSIPSNVIRDWIHKDYKLRFIVGEEYAPGYDPGGGE